jgi:hypothetical protein
MEDWMGCMWNVWHNVYYYGLFNTNKEFEKRSTTTKNEKQHDRLSNLLLVDAAAYLMKANVIVSSLDYGAHLQVMCFGNNNKNEKNL